MTAAGGSAGSAAQEFAAALKNMREQAGNPTAGELVRQAGGQRPPVRLNAKTLSDWFAGKSVPEDEAAVQFLVAYLGPRAARTGHPVPVQPWWARLREQAWQERHTNPGGRPTTRSATRRRGQGRLGRPVRACDPLVLEVHPAIEVAGQDRSGSRLPAYVVRGHDERLREAAGQVMDGSSRLVTLVGGSSTGKTRACWELALYLDQRQPGRWWLWHPHDPTRPEAAALDQAGPYTIVWLNEAQFYLAPPDVRLGERIAAGLRTLLHDRRRAPVLVLATLWPQHWSALTTRPAAGEPDPYAQARDLLVGTAITVADVFTPAELAGLDGSGVDPRLRQAAAHAEGGRITQYLAGAPELEDRYRMAPPAARAIIQVAMDSRRLGHPLALPHALLEQAAPGYLDDHDWDSVGEDWLELALAYTAQPCKGARGPLARIHARPGDPPVGDGRPCYRLADYLEQTGRGDRAGVYPPESLWKAFATVSTDPDLLRQLGRRAEARGRYQHAIWLYTLAADRGDTAALQALAWLRQRAGDPIGDALAVQAADRGDTAALRTPARRQEESGDLVGVEDLYGLAGPDNDIGALEALAWLREQAGDPADAEALLRQAAEDDDEDALWALARRQEEAGDPTGVEALYRQAADRGDTAALEALAWLREQAGDPAGAEALAVQAAEDGDSSVLVSLAWWREQAGDLVGAEALYRQAAERGDEDALECLVLLWERAGDLVGAEALAVQAADHGNTGPLLALARRREEAGDPAGAGRRMCRFGLTGTSEVATRLDFGSYGGVVPE